MTNLNPSSVSSTYWYGMLASGVLYAWAELLSISLCLQLAFVLWYNASALFSRPASQLILSLAASIFIVAACYTLATVHSANQHNSVVATVANVLQQKDCALYIMSFHATAEILTDGILMTYWKLWLIKCVNCYHAYIMFCYRKLTRHCIYW